MGINGFRVKLIAFALGATLAGLAGTVSAHVTYSVVPTPYQFAGSTPPNSAFLLAAVVLGGMGTVAGPILGAALLYLLPEKLVFLQDKSLLAFGIALILLMRFRPEGIIANRRNQLEFHETGRRQQGGGISTMTTQPTPVLEARNVTMRFGGLTAVRSVDFTVNSGEIVGLIGPNGAGKTTFFNCLTGLYVPTEGTVSYKGTVLPPKPHLVTQAGIARTFQNIRLFANKKEHYTH